MCFSKSNTAILFDNLGRPLDHDNTNQALWNDKCDYLELEEILNLNPKENNLTMLQLNIRSMLGKQNELNSILNTLYTNKSLPKILLLSETHLTKSKLRHLDIPNYQTLSRNRQSKGGGGVAICVHNSLKYKRRLDLDEYYAEHFECIFIEHTTRNHKTLIIGSLYRPPNTKSSEFIRQYKKLIQNLQKEIS